MKLVIDIPEKWFNDMVREEFTEVDELCAIIQHSTPLEQEPCEVKEIYNKGYADGQRALAEHISLCKEEQE